MQSHTIQRTHKNKKSKTVGRGGTRGKTAGRGTKGQNARAGHKKRPEMRDFIKRIPKLRGRGKNVNTSIVNKAQVVSLFKINSAFKAGDTVSPKSLLALGLITTVSGAMPRVKILGGGTIDKKLVITGCDMSASAKKAIDAGGLTTGATK